MITVYLTICIVLQLCGAFVIVRKRAGESGVFGGAALAVVVALFGIATLIVHLVG